MLCCVVLCTEVSHRTANQHHQILYLTTATQHRLGAWQHGYYAWQFYALLYLSLMIGICA